MSLGRVLVCLSIVILASLCCTHAQDVAAIQLGSYESMVSEAMAHATALAQQEEADQAAFGEPAPITDFTSLMDLGLDTMVTMTMEDEPSVNSALSADLLSTIGAINRVADNVTATMEIPQHTFGGEASVHAVLARYAADAARRASESAKDFFTVSQAASDNAVKHANLGKSAKKASLAVVAPATSAPVNVASLKAAKLAKAARKRKALKKKKPQGKKKKKVTKYKPLTPRKGLDLKKARAARRAIAAVEARIAKIQAALLKDPKNTSLLAVLEAARKAKAKARAKMLKAFKRPPPLKKKPYAPAKYLKGSVREQCVKQGPAAWYLSRYPKLAKRFGTDKLGREKAFRHFCVRGKLEGRESCFMASCEKFNPLGKSCSKNPGKFYLMMHDDLSAAFGDDVKAAEKHFRKHGAKEKRVNCFPAVKVKKFKKKAPPSAKSPKKRKAQPMAPLDEKEETDCQYDKTTFYLDQHQDVKNWAGPFLRIIGRYHWCVWGQREGRAGCYDRKTDCTEWNAPKKQEACTKDPIDWYGRQNPDIYRWVGNNREWFQAHFCRWGRHERRPHCFENIPEFCKRWDPKQPRCAENPLKWYNKEWPHLSQSYGPSKQGLRRTKEWYCHWGRGWGQDNCFKDPQKFCSPRYDAKSAECKANPEKWYLGAWFDLGQAFGNNTVRAQEHFCKWGKHEGRANCFPPAGPKRKAYCARWLPKSARCKTNPAKWYLGAHPELRSAFGKNEKAATRQFCEYGKHQGRANCFNKKKACQKWDPKSALCKANPAKWYVNMYPDLKAAFGDNAKKARKHWEKHGRKEGRASCFKRKKKGKKFHH